MEFRRVLFRSRCASVAGHPQRRHGALVKPNRLSEEHALRLEKIELQIALSDAHTLLFKMQREQYLESLRNEYGLQSGDSLDIPTRVIARKNGADHTAPMSVEMTAEPTAAHKAT